MCEKEEYSQNSSFTNKTEEPKMIYTYHQKIEGVWYSVAVQNDQIYATNYSFEEQDLKRLLRRLPADVQFQVAKESSQLLDEVLGALKEIFDGEDRGSYGFKISMNYLSTYSRKVLNCTRLVPVGYVTTYGDIARVVGGSARSVGRVEASNPFPLLIPCHRVVRSDLSIGGYGYGEQVKMELLQREERHYEKPRILKAHKRELALFPAKRVKQNRESF
jgi:methylated-DNA-[protein]-cysteine S-methyltransferase